MLRRAAVFQISFHLIVPGTHYPRATVDGEREKGEGARENGRCLEQKKGREMRRGRGTPTGEESFNNVVINNVVDYLTGSG
jgi:hypothetical protein